MNREAIGHPSWHNWGDLAIVEWNICLVVDLASPRFPKRDTEYLSNFNKVTATILYYDIKPNIFLYRVPKTHLHKSRLLLPSTARSGPIVIQL